MATDVPLDSDVSSLRPQALGLRDLPRPFLEASLVGMLLGLVDVHQASGIGPLFMLFYFFAGILLGFRHAGRAWVCWLPLGLSLYAAHVVAIACGYKQPYVERDLVAARVTLIYVIPAGLGLMIGTPIRVLFATAGLLQRKKGPPVRLLPRTIGGLVAVVVGIALAMGILRWIVFDSGTVYSSRYDEDGFQRVRAGMTVEQVEGLIGPPIMIHDGSPDGRKTWAYTRGASDTSDHWRRWIFISEGRVESVVSDFWFD